MVSAEEELRASRVGQAGIVAAMNLGMAVQATPALGDGNPVPVSHRAGRSSLACQQRLRCAMRRMACLAQEWRTHLQHAFCRGAVRIMAIRAVVADRLVVMYEWPAFLHVAGVASIVDGIAFHQFHPSGAMRIMAIGASHFAFGYRMMGRSVDLRALVLVAFKANLRLGELVAHLILEGVDLVTRNA